MVCSRVLGRNREAHRPICKVGVGPIHLTMPCSLCPGQAFWSGMTVGHNGEVYSHKQSDLDVELHSTVDVLCNGWVGALMCRCFLTCELPYPNPNPTPMETVCQGKARQSKAMKGRLHSIFPDESHQVLAS
ncbi:unnamed protein product [Discosporangium mesarthrocarpum]